MTFALGGDRLSAIKTIPSKSKRRKSGRAPLILALEPRMMFDGAAVGAAHAPADAAAKALIPVVPAPVEVRAANSAKDNGKQEAVFVDTSVSNWQALVASVEANSPGMAVELIGAGQSGLAQIATWAETNHGFDSIHILSQGGEATLRLGSDTLTAASLSTPMAQAELAEIGSALKTGGEVLLYGSKVAAGTDGQIFVSDLAADTGAVVAASGHAVGDASLGGRWALDTAAGTVTAPSLTAPNYLGLLNIGYAATDNSPAPVEVQAANAVLDGGKLEAAFIDTSVVGWQSLVAGIEASRPGIGIELIDGTESGLAQMANWALAHNGYDSIHVLSHGAEAQLYLGTDSLTDPSLLNSTVKTELTEIGHALKPGGDLLVYGCDVAKGADGRLFITDLAAGTGAIVAASTDLTGASRLGGDWTLEYATGRVDSTALSIAGYQGILTVPVIDLNGVAAGTGNTVTLANANGGLALAPSANVSDAVNDLSNWNGGSLTVQRVTPGGSADSSVNDVYSFVSSGLFNVTGGRMSRGSDASGTLTAAGNTEFATWAYTSATGKLVISFETAASTALVQDVVRHIGYSDATPYGNAAMRFSLNDGAATATADALVTSGTIYVDKAISLADYAPNLVANTSYDTSLYANAGFSLTEALAVAGTTVGDTILIQNGTYVGQFVATSAVTIDAVNGASGNVTLSSPDNANLVASTQNSMRGDYRYVILDLRTATPGAGTITVRDLNIDGRYQAPTQAQNSAGNGAPGKDMVGIATYNTNAVIDHVNVQHIAALWGVNGDLEGISTHSGLLAEGSTALGAAKVTVTIKNSYIASFQKDGIDAWGANLYAIITNNTIVGSGQHGLSAQNGIQIGSWNLNRFGTTGIISGNTITNLGAPDALVASSGYVATGIYHVSAGSVEDFNNTVTLDPGASANSLLAFDISYGFQSWVSPPDFPGTANVHDNKMNGMSVGIQVDSPSITSIHKFSNNTLTTPGGIPVLFYYAPLGNGDTGGNTIAGFGFGEVIQVVGENFSKGSVTYGNGTAVAANSVRISVSGNNTVLYIDSTVANSTNSAPLPITLEGVYAPSNFVLNGAYISFITGAPSVQPPPPSLPPVPPLALTRPAPPSDTNTAALVTIVHDDQSGSGMSVGTPQQSSAPVPAPAGAPVIALAPMLSAPNDSGFQVAVVAAPTSGTAGNGDAVVVAKPIGTVEMSSGTVSFSVPSDAFAVAQATDSVTLSATQANGQPLPPWLSFNSQTGEFQGTPPAGTKAIDIKVTAHDRAGKEAAQVFTINTQAGNRHSDATPIGRAVKLAQAGRPGLTAQLHAARHAASTRMAAMIEAGRRG